MVMRVELFEVLLMWLWSIKVGVTPLEQVE